MKILLIDDRGLIREALRGVIKELKGDACMLKAADCRQTMQLLEHLTLPDGDGFSMLAELRERYPSTASRGAIGIE